MNETLIYLVHPVRKLRVILEVFYLLPHPSRHVLCILLLNISCSFHCVLPLLVGLFQVLSGFAFSLEVLLQAATFLKYQDGYTVALPNALPSDLFPLQDKVIKWKAHWTPFKIYQDLEPFFPFGLYPSWHLCPGPTLHSCWATSFVDIFLILFSLHGILSSLSSIPFQLINTNSLLIIQLLERPT